MHFAISHPHSIHLCQDCNRIFHFNSIVIAIPTYCGILQLKQTQTLINKFNTLLELACPLLGNHKALSIKSPESIIQSRALMNVRYTAVCICFHAIGVCFYEVWLKLVCWVTKETLKHCHDLKLSTISGEISPFL